MEDFKFELSVTFFSFSLILCVASLLLVGVVGVLAGKNVAEDQENGRQAQIDKQDDEGDQIGLICLLVDQWRYTQRNHKTDEITRDIDYAAAERVTDTIFLRLLYRKLIANKNHGQHEEAYAGVGGAKHGTTCLGDSEDEESKR